MKKLAFSVLLLFVGAVSAFAQATPGPALPAAVPIQQSVERADAATNAAHSHTTGATITLSAGTAGSLTQSVYVTGLDISVCENGTGAAAAAPLYITTTGINGSPQYQVAGGTNNAAMLGWCSPVSTVAFTAPLKSQTPGTNVTFVLPTFGSGETVSVNVYFRLGY